MSERRFTDKPDLAPWAVRGLALDHPAMLEDRTLFPGTVIEVTETEPACLLVSGENNRKLGKTVEKGAFKGYRIYGLSLEERATCPSDCAVRDICYGNGMQLARRHRIGDPDVFYDRLGFELAELCDTHEGVLVRLHVLGDFPSVDYVGFWLDALNEYPNLAVYGYTARRTTAWAGDEIGDAIEAAKDQFPDRFRIRWSSSVARPDGALVINHVPKQPRIDEGIVCPAQTDATACCATCGLCWEPAAARESIVFIRHGPKSNAMAAESAMEAAQAEPPPSVAPAAQPVRAAPLAPESPTHAAATRAVQPLKLTPAPRPITVGPPPRVRLVAPTDLRIEATYQRDLSNRSISLIRKIVNGWDWTKFKPPVCAQSPEGALFVIDGQHTAIAAASRPEISEIPVLIVKAPAMESRAAAFVSHNRDRLVMSPLQIFHADAAAGDKVAQELLTLAKLAGASIPRGSPAKGKGKPGQLVAVRQLRGFLGSAGADVVERLFKIAVAAEASPLTRTVTVGLMAILTAPIFADVAKMPNSRIANALKAIGDVEAKSKAYATETGQTQERACAAMIANACREVAEVAA